MASIHKEIRVNNRPENVWAALREFFQQQAEAA